MKKGIVINDLEMIDIASNGRAVGKIDGKVVFVNELVPGDIADVRIYKKKRKYLEASPLKISKRSEFRAKPVCEHFGLCGGCKWQNLDYQKQLEFKESHVRSNLLKLSGVNIPEIKPIIGSDNIYHYRNKLEFTFSDHRWLTNEEIESGENLNRDGLGFHIPGRFDKVLDINTCYLQDNRSNEIRNFIKVHALKLGIPFFNLREQTGILRNLIIRNTSLGQWMVILSVFIINDRVRQLLEDMSKQFPWIDSIQFVVNAKGNDTISDLDVECFRGSMHIEEKINNIRYLIGPKSFFQTNTQQAEVLYRKVREFAEIKENEVVYDLYSGTGTIANYIARDALKVFGMEYVKEAVEDAKANAVHNSILNTNFYSGDLKDLLNSKFMEELGKPDVIITDPPRAGMHEDVVKGIMASNADRIVYVSCNSATQARDIGLLSEKYEPVMVQPIDMFPQTSHVENVVLMNSK